MLLLGDTLVACQDLALGEVSLACTHDLASHKNLALSIRCVTLGRSFFLLSVKERLVVTLMLLELLLSFESP